MATSYDVNLKIGSAIGFNVVGRGLIRGLTPIQTTTLTLDGDVFSPSGYNTGTRTLSITPLTDFLSSPGTTSTSQIVRMTNNGNAVLTVTDILYSKVDGIYPQFYFDPGVTILNSSTITILPNNTATFQLAYLARDAAEYNSYIIIVSNSDSGYYKLRTRQLVVNSADFSVSPTEVNTSTTSIGYNNTFTYYITPIVNYVSRPDLILPIEGTITGSPAWTIDSIGTNSITVRFNPNEINNADGMYVSNLLIKANDIYHQVTNTAMVSIDPNKNKHLASWISAASHYNSIIGVSYDLEDDIKYITIGVGIGADNSPIYGSGGNAFANVANLGLGAGTATVKYPFWADVYKIPLDSTGTPQVYHSADYIVKTTNTYEGLDYNAFFGEYRAPGSMFIIEDDGYGSATIEINHLRDLGSDIPGYVADTLRNLTRAFHYYSNVDINGRYTPLPPEYANPNAFDTSTTNLFIGFNYNTRDKLAFVNTSIVPLPV
jgi:hypothetical protein